MKCAYGSDGRYSTFSRVFLLFTRRRRSRRFRHRRLFVDREGNTIGDDVPTAVASPTNLVVVGRGAVSLCERSAGFAAQRTSQDTLTHTHIHTNMARPTEASMHDAGSSWVSRQTGSTSSFAVALHRSPPGWNSEESVCNGRDCPSRARLAGPCL